MKQAEVKVVVQKMVKAGESVSTIENFIKEAAKRNSVGKKNNSTKSATVESPLAQLISDLPSENTSSGSVGAKVSSVFGDFTDKYYSQVKNKEENAKKREDELDYKISDLEFQKDLLNNKEEKTEEDLEKELELDNQISLVVEEIAVDQEEKNKKKKTLGRMKMPEVTKSLMKVQLPV